MRITIAQLRQLIREALEDAVSEDTDRVRRHLDGYGDDMEEGIEVESTDLQECGDMMEPTSTAAPQPAMRKVVVVPVESKRKG